MEFLRQIKIILITLYCIILGFIVFCNTSVFGYEITEFETSPYQVTQSFDNYFYNMQDEFDYNMFVNPRQALSELQGIIYNRLNDPNYNYYVEKVNNTGHGSDAAAAGYKVYLYSTISENNNLSLNQDFNYANFSGYNDLPNLPQQSQNIPFYYPTVTITYRYCYSIYNWGQSWVIDDNGDFLDLTIPFCVFNYTHPVFHNYYLNSNTSGATQITSAIQSQTNTIKQETQKQTNAVVSATQSQTNALLDTNSTGNDTMSVNDTTSDTSANLGGLYNQIDDAFTSDAVILYDSHTFNLTLPNGDSFPIVLRTQFFRSFLDNNPVFKAFYQSIFWVIFGGYVIFDFKKIINKMKEGNIDNVVGSSNPVDSVVNMSLK